MVFHKVKAKSWGKQQEDRLFYRPEGLTAVCPSGLEAGLGGILGGSMGSWVKGSYKVN